MENLVSFDPFTFSFNEEVHEFIICLLIDCWFFFGPYWSKIICISWGRLLLIFNDLAWFQNDFLSFDNITLLNELSLWRQKVLCFSSIWLWTNWTFQALWRKIQSLWDSLVLIIRGTVPCSSEHASQVSFLRTTRCLIDPLMNALLCHYDVVWELLSSDW